MALIAIICSLGAIFYWVSNDLQELRAADADDVSWSLSQVEVDLILLREYANQNKDTVSVNELRKRFDTIYNRVNLVSEAPVYEKLREDKKFKRQLKMLQTCFNNLIPIINSEDNELLSNLKAIPAELKKVSQVSHNIALTGIKLQSEHIDAERSQFTNLLFIAGAALGFLILSLFVLAFFLVRQGKKTEDYASQIERTSARLNSSFTSSLDAIIVSDQTGTILDFNEAAATVFGYDQEEAIGQKMEDLIVPTHLRDAHIDGMARYIKEGTGNLVNKGRVELTALRKNGEEFPIEISIGSSSSNEGIIFVAYMRDITDRLQAEEDLRSARDDALEAEKTKSNFLAVMSHEMRTPLNGLFGTLDLLKNTKLSNSQREYLNLAANSGDILLHHVNDVLDITRLDAEKMELAPSAFDLRSFFETIVDTNQSIARARNNELNLQLGEMPEKFAFADHHRLRQVVYNLLGNALKFTENGQVDLVVNCSNDQLEFSVTDTGVGISDEDKERIFEEFYTQGQSYDRYASGTGLGLAITKRIVDVMKGEISVESQVGTGTTFTIQLPLELTDELGDQGATSGSVDFTALKGRKVLLVEDNDVNRLIVCQMLDDQGIIVTETANGREAVDAIMKGHYDLVLMDVSMPVMNGIDATEEIRKFDAQTPIIGLTAHALPEEQARFKTVGMNGCLIKPVSSDVLLKTIYAHIIQKQDPNLPQEQPQMDNVLNLDVYGQLKSAFTSEKMTTILTSYEAEIEQALLTLDAQLRAKNFEAARATVHKSAGSSGMIGAREMADAFTAIEAEIKSGNTSKLPYTIADLHAIWSRTKVALKIAA